MATFGRLKQRPRQPLIPGTAEDRTGAQGILRRANAAIRQRWAGLEAEVLAIFGRIRVISQVAQNDTRGTPRTIYALTPDEMAAVTQALREAFDRWIEAVAGGSYRTHWYAQFDLEAARLGAAQSVANLTGLSATYAASRDLSSAIFSQPFVNRVAMAQIKSYEHWTGLSAGERSALSQIIGRGIADGKGVRALRKEISERLDVSLRQAEAYAQTDLTDTLRMTRLDERDWAVENLGMNIGLLWKSALIPTTRPWHASRNGRIYTSAEVRDFYSRDGNIYRCFLPGTRVAGRFSAGVKSHYKGPAFRLVTAAGHELAVTANHPVLTARGMVPAAEVRKGDYLVSHCGQVKAPAAGVGKLHRELMGARIEDVFAALVDAGHQSAGRVAAVDLHGDAAFCQPEVDVVRADRELVFGMDAATGQLLDQLALVCADAPTAAVRALDLFRHRDVTHAGGDVGLGNVFPALSIAQLAHPVPLPVASVAPLQPEALEAAQDRAAADAGPLADRKQRLAGHVGSMQRGAYGRGSLPGPFVDPEPGLVESLCDRAVAAANAVGDVLHRFAGLAAFDEVVDVVVSQYEGHVFDLQERSGLMLGSNIVASNCHCSVTECLLDDNGRPLLTERSKQTSRDELARWKAQQRKKAKPRA